MATHSTGWSATRILADITYYVMTGTSSKLTGSGAHKRMEGGEW